ncbi:MAG: acyloxyacyl hydrolase [Bacteroidales bacterium]
MPLKKINTALLILVSLILILNKTTYAQDSSFVKRLTFSVEPQWGFVMPHHDYMAYFLEENITGFQLNVGLLTLGTKNWHKYYNYPQIGAGFYHSTLGNDEIYGKMNALYLYIDRKFLPMRYRFNIGNRIAFGASHVSKYYDKNTNPQNIIIATPINAFIQYDIMAYFRINSHISLKGSFGFTHTSNGSIKDPNKGFNIVTSSFGLQYAISDERNVFKDATTVDEFQKRHTLYLGIVSGCKSISRLDDKTYAIVGLTGEYLYELNPTTSIGGEVVAYYDASNKDESDPDDAENFKDIDYINITFNPTYALRFGKVLFTFQPGLYLRNTVNQYSLATNKVGLRYQCTPNMLVSMAIKAHWLAKADFIEFGIRYNILRRN